MYMYAVIIGVYEEVNHYIQIHVCMLKCAKQESREKTPEASLLKPPKGPNGICHLRTLTG